MLTNADVCDARRFEDTIFFQLIFSFFFPLACSKPLSSLASSVIITKNNYTSSSDVQDSIIMLIFIETVPWNKSLDHLSLLKKETVGAKKRNLYTLQVHKKREIYVHSRCTEREIYIHSIHKKREIYLNSRYTKSIYTPCTHLTTSINRNNTPKLRVSFSKGSMVHYPPQTETAQTESNARRWHLITRT